ncbi:MAG: flagellar basal body rod protein FlgC [bacterium]
MSLDSLNISASALYAQRVKMDTISSNMANVNTTRKPDGTIGAYRRKDVVFAAEYNKAMNNDVSFDETQIGRMGGNPMLRGRVSSDSTSVSTGVNVSQIVEDQSPTKKLYNPSHPDADKDGYVEMPNVNIVTEMVDMIAANRAYEANVTTIDTTKSMIASALRI